MNSDPRARAFLVALGAAAMVFAANADAQPPRPLFSKIADIPIGARTSRFDYLSLDAETGRLYVAKMGSAKLLVFDTRQQAVVAELAGYPKVTGVLAVPELHKVYASVPGAGLSASLSVALGMAGISSGSGGVAILDTQTLREIARVPGGVFPDGIAYDPNDKRIFVTDELGSGVGVIDVTTNKVVARLDTGGEVGNVQYDPVTQSVYAPIQSRNEMIVIDPKALKVMRHFALPGSDHPHGLRIAHGAAIGYAAADGNDKLLTINLRSGKVLGSAQIGHDPDVLADDPDLKRLYIASESGVLSVFDVSDPENPRKLGDYDAGPNAHSLAVDPVTHRLFLPLRDLNGKSVMRILAAQ